MVIDKIAEYFTPKMVQRWNVIRGRMDILNREMDALGKVKGLDEERITAELTAINDRLNELMEELSELNGEARRAYRAAKTDEEIFADVKEVLDSITHDDYLHYLDQQKKRYSLLPEIILGSLPPSTPNGKDPLKQFIKEGYESCIFYLHLCIIYYVDAIIKNEIEEEMMELARKKALAWYPQREVMPSIKPAQHIMPNSVLSNYTRKYKTLNAGEFELPFANATKGRRAIEGRAIITCGKVLGTANITEYEQQVMNAVCSIWHESKKQGQNCIFTVDEVYRAMPHGGRQPSKEQKKAIENAIDKLSDTTVEFDATEYLNKIGAIEQGTQFNMREKWITCVKGTYITENGKKEVSGYRIFKEPPALTLAKMTKQIITVRPEVLELRQVKNRQVQDKALTTNMDRVSITGYMILRIEVMRHDEKEAENKKRRYDNKRNKTLQDEVPLPDMPLAHFRKYGRTIDFDRLMHATEAGTGNEKRNRQFIFDVLDYWVAIGHIKGYTKVTEGRSHAVTGVKIDV